MDSTNLPGYRTSDLYYAAYLKVAGVPMTGTQREGSRMYFVFDENGPVSIKELKQQYYNRSSKVAALSYADDIKVCKALTHDDRGQ